MAVAPGHAHLPAIEILHLDKFLASRQLLTRYCASAHLPASCNRDNLPATYQICTATRVMLNQLCTLTAKIRAIPSLHRDSFLAKVPGLWSVPASGNTTSLYCRAVSFNKLRRNYILTFYKFLLACPLHVATYQLHESVINANHYAPL
jgi:hypothetical protein